MKLADLFGQDRWFRADIGLHLTCISRFNLERTCQGNRHKDPVPIEYCIISGDRCILFPTSIDSSALENLSKTNPMPFNMALALTKPVFIMA